VLVNKNTSEVICQIFLIPYRICAQGELGTNKGVAVHIKYCDECL